MYVIWCELGPWPHSAVLYYGEEAISGWPSVHKKQLDLIGGQFVALSTQVASQIGVKPWCTLSCLIVLHHKQQTTGAPINGG